MRKFIFKSFVELTGNPTVSSLLKSFSQSKISKPFVRPFSSTFKLNEQEMEKSLDNYKSIHDLFTRKLVPSARPISNDDKSIISPVDGVVNALGPIHADQTFYVKQQLYNLKELLGSKEAAKRYEEGYYIVLYLSPSHYHRIHYPVTGQLVKRWALGETSYPVNRLGEKYGERIFSKNYRIISELQTQERTSALIKVGALNINSICLTNANRLFNKGDELGFFSFGSTVILLFEKECKFIPTVKNGQEIKMGQSIGEAAI